MCRGRQNVDHGARLAGFQQVAHDALHHEERAAYIDRHMPVEQFRRGVGQAAARCVGGGIDQRVDVAVMINGGGDSRLAIRRVGGVAGNEQAVSPGIAKLRCRGLAAVGVAAGDGQPRAALPDQAFGHGNAEPLGAASDQGAGAAVINHCQLLPTSTHWPLSDDLSTASITCSMTSPSLKDGRPSMTDWSSSR